MSDPGLQWGLCSSDKLQGLLDLLVQRLAIDRISFPITPPHSHEGNPCHLSQLQCFNKSSYYLGLKKKKRFGLELFSGVQKLKDITKALVKPCLPLQSASPAT